MLGIEQLAGLHAALLAGARWDDLLREEGVTRAQWLAAEKACLDALTDESARSGSELRDRYLRAFHGETPQTPEPVVAMPVAAPAPQASPAPIPIRAPSPPPEPVAWMPQGMQRFTDVEGTHLAPSTASSAPALPFDPTATPVLPEQQEPSVHVPKGMRGFTDVGGTQLALKGAPAEPALPFKGEPAQQAPAPPEEMPAWMPKGMRGLAAANLEGTQLAPTVTGAESALPFEPSASPSLPALDERAPWMPKGMRNFADVGGTQIAPKTAPTEPALPFEPGTPLAQTVTLPSTLKAGPPVLQADTAAPSTPELSLQQYASLRVELDLYPARREETLRRYHVPEAQLAALAAMWASRLAADPRLRSALEAAYTAYRGRLVASQGGSST